jgi:uncharacterized heparinase superfamily protein
LSIDWYQSDVNTVFYPLEIPASRLLTCSEGKLQAPMLFSFLNRSRKFSPTVDWNFMQYGKLWNYNLQYFDYLHDQTICTKDKIALVEDFSQLLVSRKIKLEPYPVSLRLINWIIFSSESNYFSHNFSKALMRQASYLRHNLEYHIQANHLLENYIALCFCDLFFGNKEMLYKNFSKIKRQLDIQILPDGGHYECSPMYHSIITSRLLILYEALAAKDYVDINLILKNVLSRMIAWLQAILFRSGMWAHMNDATEGIAPAANSILSVAEKLQISKTYSTLKESGFRKIDCFKMEVLIDVGNIIPPYQPGHAHADMLSFVLECNKKPVIVDTGISTYDYTAERHFQRSTAAHNTVTVNNKDQSEVWGSFRVGRRAKLSLLVDKPERVEASHDGYVKKMGLTHIRSFEMIQGDVFCITDKVEGSGLKKNHTCFSHFHFDHTISVIVQKLEWGYNIDAGDVVLDIIGATNVHLEDYNQALSYNKIANAKVLQALFINSLNVTITAK